MSTTDIKERVERLDPLLVDTAIAVGLMLLVFLQLWIFSQGRGPGFPTVPNWRPEMAGRRSFGMVPYFLVALTFLPLAIRRQVPWLALLLSGTGAIAYTVQPGLPPAPIVFGPMIALYTLAANATRRRTGMVALMVVLLVAAVPLLAYSSSVRWVADSVGSLVLLAAAALLGEATRNRREYIEQVEQRAIEAERTREEEALRRVDEERIRIAREVHDIVAHSLSIVTIQASAAETLIDKNPEKARESILNVRTTGKDALAELRSMLEVLRTGEGEPMAPAAEITQVEKLAEPLREAGIDVNLRTGGNLATVPAYASVSAYRIAQEALTNIVRHAEASKVDIDITLDPVSLSLTVSDDGLGSTGTSAVEGHGILGMRERVEALGGTFGAGPLPERGFRVSATIPLRSS